MGFLQLGSLPGHLGGVLVPDVEDAGGQGDAFSGPGERGGVVHAAVAPEPDHAEAEFFQLGCRASPLLLKCRVFGAQFVAEDSEAAQGLLR